MFARWRMGAAAGFCLALALSFAAAQGRTGNKYAFLVACSKYDKTQLHPLPYTIDDVEGFKKALVTTGFDAEHIVVLHDNMSETRYRPIKANILKELRLLLAGMGPEDTLVLAVSGHGLHYKGDKTGYFCPVDARLDDKSTLIPMDTPDGLFEILRSCQARQKLLIVNACRNDPTTNIGLAATKIQVDDEDSDAVPEGIAAIYSCRQGQKSYFDPDRKLSLFYDHLIRAWKGEYQKGAGKVKLEHVLDQVVLKTKLDANKTLGALQVPEVRREYKGEWVIGDATLPPLALSKYLELDLGPVKMKLVRIEPGAFTMGSPADERYRDDDESQHEVEIVNPFYMAVYEVMQAQYQRLMGKNPSWFSAGGGGKDRVQGLNTDDFPVENVSWDEAVKFCSTVTNLLQAKGQGWLLDLPTEAEWEYACRAGSKTPFHFGDTISTDQANYEGNFVYGNGQKGVYRARTVKTGSFAANAWGLYDTHGNVWEWCKDWYDKDYYKNSPRLDPQGPANGSNRVVRGGSWVFVPWSCRAASRVDGFPGIRTDDVGLGFRVVLRLSPRSQ